MKRIAKSLITTGIIVAGAITTSQPVFGQFTANDLYMGFQNAAGGGSADYIINLGPVSALLGQSSVVNLGNNFSLADFNAVLGSSSTMLGGAVAGKNAGIGATADIFATQTRVGGAGSSPAVAGSTVSATATKAQDNSAVADLTAMVCPAYTSPANTNNGVLDTSKSWEADIDNLDNSVLAVTGVDPDSAVGPATVLYEDLYETSSSGGASNYVYQGYVTLNLTGANPMLTFTSTNVPGQVQLQPPVFKSISKAGGTVTLAWTSVSNHTYQLQYTANVMPTNWVNIGAGVLATNTMMTNTDTPGAATHRFYRVTAQ